MNHRLLSSEASYDVASKLCGRTSTLSALVQGLTLAHFKAQLEDLQDTSLTLELNLSTFGTHPRANLGYIGDNMSLS